MASNPRLMLQFAAATGIAAMLWVAAPAMAVPNRCPNPNTPRCSGDGPSAALPSSESIAVVAMLKGSLTFATANRNFPEIPKGGSCSGP